MTSHTPGPWNFTEGTTNDGLTVWWIHQGDCSNPEYRVCKVPRTRIREELEIANAHLIAAAPDLLAALEDAEHTIGLLRAIAYPDKPQLPSPSLNTLHRVQAAIAKAKGETT